MRYDIWYDVREYVTMMRVWSDMFIHLIFTLWWKYYHVIHTHSWPLILTDDVHSDLDVMRSTWLMCSDYTIPFHITCITTSIIDDDQSSIVPIILLIFWYDMLTILILQYSLLYCDIYWSIYVCIAVLWLIPLNTNHTLCCEICCLIHYLLK